MRRTRALAFLPALVAAAAAIIAAAPSPATHAPAQQKSPGALQVQTRLVTVDVIAADSHGNAIRGLKREDFQISDSGPQKIQQFAFIDKASSLAAAKSPTAAPAQPKGYYTNQTQAGALSVPPTIVLMDSLNTNIQDLARTRRYMLNLLKTLPSNTPVAVFLLGQSLRIVQDFTTDPATLRAAVDKTISPSGQQGPMPQDDPDSVSLAMFDANGGQEDDVIQALENFEKETYASTMDIRVDTTLDALTAIAKYLNGFSGRKNLIWVSESFPIALLPDPDFGSAQMMFESMRNYGSQAKDTADALASSQVAVYPVDARGLDTIQVFGASQRPVFRANSASRNLQSALRREQTQRDNSQDTMEEIAEDTGGKTCKNTNDLSGCIEAALADGSAYYELAYDPSNIKWDGSFHKISVKTTHPGVHLSYRRGYFATDQQLSANGQTSAQRLQEACKDFVPSPSIPIVAQEVVSPTPGQIALNVSIASSGLSLASDTGEHKVSAMMAECLYNAGGREFQFQTRDLSGALSDADYAAFQRSGFSGYLDFPRTGASRVRIAVLDLQSGQVGALDVPIPRAAPAAVAPASSSALLQPHPAPTPTPTPSGAHAPASPVSTTIGFSVPSGQSGALDWGGSALIYKGTLGIDQTSAAFFQKFFFSLGYHCDAADGLVRKDSDGNNQKPSLRFAFSGANGQTALIDLSGDEPEYGGSLPVDDTAKAFFQSVWYLTHCGQTPEKAR